MKEPPVTRRRISHTSMMLLLPLPFSPMSTVSWSSFKRIFSMVRRPSTRSSVIGTPCRGPNSAGLVKDRQPARDVSPSPSEQAIVPLSPRHALPIELLEQDDRLLPPEPRELLELGDREARRPREVGAHPRGEIV